METINYYAHHSATEIYRLLYTSLDPFELSTVLYFISINEKHLRSRLLGIFNPADVEYPNFDGSNQYSISNSRIRDNLFALRDPHFRDHYILGDISTTREYQPLAVVAFLDEVYWGHVYIWPIQYTSRQYVINVMGIRTSIYHLVNRIGGIAKYLLSGIRKYASILDADFAFVRILSPFPSMQDLCLRLGMQTPQDFAKLHPELDWVRGVYLDELGNYVNMDEIFYVGEGPVTSEEESYDHSVDRLIAADQPLIGEVDLKMEILTPINDLPKYKCEI